MTDSIYDIKYQPLNNIAYLHNPKVACSTIKNTMLYGKEENVHAQFLFPVFNNPYVDVFSVVRNPYTRIISAYLDKVGPKKDDWVWLPFARSNNLDPTKPISFDKFLDVLLETKSLREVDHHFRPQSYNLFCEQLVPGFIGYLEDMKEVEVYLKSHGLDMLNRAPHKTKSSQSKKELLTESNIEKIKIIYADDFNNYKYSLDPNEKFNLKPIVNKQVIPLAIFENYQKLDIEDIVNTTRDSALLLESIDLDQSLKLMRIAEKFRPDGVTIKAKIKQYLGEV